MNTNQDKGPEQLMSTELSFKKRLTKLKQAFQETGTR